MISNWQQLRTQLTWQAMAGCLLLACGLFFYYFQLQPLEEHLAAIKSDASLTQEKLAAGRSLASSDATLGKFYAFFESRDSITDVLAKVHSISETYGIGLKQVRYKLIKNPDSRLLQYQMTIQATGEYSRIRNFSLQVMNIIPSVSLDTMRFERQSTSSGLVDSELILSLYMVRS